MTGVAVVGAGIVGLATAFALVERGARVTVYERGRPGAGQSGGESRIFRHAHDDPRLVALARESRTLWRDWERRFGVELVSPDGTVALGPTVDSRLALLQRAGVRARPIDAAELAERLPLLAPGRHAATAGEGRDVRRPRTQAAGEDRDALSTGVALIDEDGGVIRTGAAIRSLVGALGDRLVGDEVIAVDASGTVRAGGGTATHERVLVCAGRDTAALAHGAGLELPVRTSTHTRFTYPVRGEPPARLACLLDARGAYGDPLPGNDRFAVGLHEQPERTNAYVAEALPGLVPEPVEARNCWVTELPWHADGIAVWELGALRFVAGGNLFKHAPALGRALAGDMPGDLRPEARLGAAR